MTKATALEMIKGYEAALAGRDGCPDAINGISSRFPVEGSINKAMRWLGFCQGVALAIEAYTLPELKEHSRLGEVK